MRKIAVISLVIYIFLFLISTIGLREDISVIYWQRFSLWFFYLRILTFFVGLTTLWISYRTKDPAWATFLILGICVIYGFVYFFSFFSANRVNHIGSVELKGKDYQLTSVSRYDEETGYYLGVCDQNSLACKFTEIYALYLFTPEPPSKIKLSNDGQELIVDLNTKAVYYFDGVNIKCEDSDFGYCINK